MKILTFSLFIFLRIDLFSQETNSQIYYAIAPVYNFKQSILSITFDDGIPIQFTNAVPLLNEKGIPATFYIISKDLKDSVFRNIIKNAYLGHHEIGSHTVDHPVLSELDDQNIEFELRQSQADIDSVLGGNRCFTLAFPFGAYNTSVLNIVKKKYLAARSVMGGYNSLASLNRYQLKIISFAKPTAELFNKRANYSTEYHLWLIELFHGIDDVGYEPFSSIEFRKHLDYILTLEKKIWFATIANVIKYYDESKGATLLCEECNDSIYKLRLDDNLDDTIYNQPLSLKIRVPDNWSDSIQINGTQFVNTLFINDSKFIFFNAIPNNQLITIKPIQIGVLKAQPAIRFLSLDPNPFFDNINVAFEVANPPFDVHIIIANLDGREIYNERINCLIPIIKLNINTNEFSKGLYLFKITIKVGSDKQVIARKLVKF